MVRVNDPRLSKYPHEMPVGSEEHTRAVARAREERDSLCTHADIGNDPALK